MKISSNLEEFPALVFYSEQAPTGRILQITRSRRIQKEVSVLLLQFPSQISKTAPES